MKEIYLEIITPAKKGFSGNVRSVTVPGTKGNFQVLYNHAPIISSLETGIIKVIDTDGNTLIFATSGGTIEVRDNKALVLAESVESPGDIDIERAGKAKERALQRLGQRKEAAIDLLRAEAALARAVNRIKTAEKYQP